MFVKIDLVIDFLVKKFLAKIAMEIEIYDREMREKSEK